MQPYKSWQLAVDLDSRTCLKAGINFPHCTWTCQHKPLGERKREGNCWQRQLSLSKRGGCTDFGQVTCPTFPPSKVTAWQTGGLPECVCVCVSTRTVSGKDANTTDACGFPPGPQTLTSLSPKCKHKTKCLAQNKQATRAEGVSPMIELKSSHPTYTHTACKLQNHMLDWATTFERQVQ